LISPLRSSDVRRPDHHGSSVHSTPARLPTASLSSMVSFSHPLDPLPMHVSRSRFSNSPRHSSLSSPTTALTAFPLTRDPTHLNLIRCLTLSHFVYFAPTNVSCPLPIATLFCSRSYSKRCRIGGNVDSKASSSSTYICLTLCSRAALHVLGCPCHPPSACRPVCRTPSSSPFQRHAVDFVCNSIRPRPVHLLCP